MSLGKALTGELSLVGSYVSQAFSELSFSDANTGNKKVLTSVIGDNGQRQGKERGAF